MRERPQRVIKEAQTRLDFHGPRALSTGELLAVVIGSGTATDSALQVAEQLLMAFDDLTGLTQAEHIQLVEIPGIGPARAARIHASLELGRRQSVEPVRHRLTVSSPKEAGKILMPLMGHLTREELWAMSLNTRGQVLRIDTIYRGSVNTSTIRIGEIFRPAIVHNATAIMLAHNHPSGIAEPSAEDVAVTRTIVKTGKQLDVAVMDHLVIGRNQYVSLRERGMGFE